MPIDRVDFEKIMGNSLTGNDSEMKISLFIVSKKDPRLKKLELGKLNREQRAEKLHKWAQDYRFVAVIEMGDTIFAHTHAKFAEQLGQKEISIEGKKVTVKSLSDEEANQLSIVGQTFEEYVLKESEEEKTEGKDSSKEHMSAFRSTIRQYFAENRLVSDQMWMKHVIARMENIPGQIILECLRRIDEARREQEKQKAADEKYFDIKKQDIKKTILKEEVTKESIATQALNQDAISEHLDQTDFIRGIES